ncbi:MAG: DUF1800 domain-containing protein [Tetrasphaera sp.]
MTPPASAPAVPALAAGSADRYASISRAAHIARRASFAATASLTAEIAAMTPNAWIDAQLNPSAIPDAACDAMLAEEFPWLALTSKQISDVTGRKSHKAATLLPRATIARRLLTKRHLLEVVVDVLTSHIYVPVLEAQFVIDFDREVTRKYALGRYSDYLQKALRHPAVLAFLDNASSTKVKPNENLGRELLELFTVGTGNYTEDDVLASAKLLTGHSYSYASMTYQYVAANHYVGPLKIMGFTTANGTAAGGPAVLTAYLNYLARHPATAKRLCRRLAVRFVSDTPSEALVNSLVKVYLSNGTSIKAVVRALLRHPEFLASAGLKWRTPQEWLTAMYAAAQAPYTPVFDYTVNPYAVMKLVTNTLNTCGAAPRGWPTVDGYKDIASAWTTTVSLQQAWQCAETCAWGLDPDFVSAPWASTLGVAEGQNVWTAATSITRQLTGFVWPTEQLSAIASMLASAGTVASPPTETLLDATMIQNHLPETVRLVLASPAFMTR